MLKSILRKAAFAAALAIGLASGAAQAATLYISEFGSATAASGSTVAQVIPQAALTDQTVALSGTTTASAAFNAKTHAVMLVCDEGCSIAFGASSITAATTNYLLQQGVPYTFAVAPSTYVAAIANAAGNSGGGGGGGNVTIVGPLGQTTMAASVSVVVASNQTAIPISAASLPLPTGAATAANQPALGQAAMAASLPVVIASNQSAVPVSGTFFQTTQPVSLATNVPLPTQSTTTTTAATVTNSSTSMLTTGTRLYLAIMNDSATATIACNLGGTAALNTAGSLTLPPYSSFTWESSFVPTEAINCISSVASSPATILSK